MSKYLKQYLVNAAISAIIGVIVGLVVIYLLGFESGLATFLLISAAYGILVGTLTKFSVFLLFRLTGRNLLFGCILTLFSAGLLTLAFSQSQAFSVKMAMLSIILPLALLTMYFNIRYFQRLNSGLKRKQAELRRQPPESNP